MIFEMPEYVTLSLLLTRKCNFRCAHCMYSCGPKSSAKYMTNETLAKVFLMARRIQATGARVSINLIGGEPTVDMAEFTRVANVACFWIRNGIEVQMTTNGWWLHKAETTRQFMDAVRGMVYATDSDLKVRISQDKYHDKFRPQHLTGKGLECQLKRVWSPEDSDDAVFVRAKSWCEKDHVTPGCLDECPECGSEDMSHDDVELCAPVPDPDEGDPWIWVETPSRYTFGGDADLVQPFGRAKDWGRNDRAALLRGCFSNDVLSFNPDGTLNDGHITGNIDDDPLVLLYLVQLAISEANPICQFCQEQMAEWRKHYLRRARKQAVVAVAALERDGKLKTKETMEQEEYEKAEAAVGAG